MESETWFKDGSDTLLGGTGAVSGCSSGDPGSASLPLITCSSVE